MQSTLAQPGVTGKHLGVIDLPDMEQKPGNAGLRSQYALRLYSWAKEYVEDGAKTISLEDLRRVFGMESVKDAEGNVIKE